MYGTKDEVSKVTSALSLFKVYDISNAYVTDVKPLYRILGEYQWKLQKGTLIQEVNHAKPNLLSYLDSLTPFNLIIDYLGNRRKSLGKYIRNSNTHLAIST